MYIKDNAMKVSNSHFLTLKIQKVKLSFS